MNVCTVSAIAHATHHTLRFASISNLQVRIDLQPEPGSARLKVPQQGWSPILGPAFFNPKAIELVSSGFSATSGLRESSRFGS